MGKPKAPTPPDYAAAAQQQGVANVNSAVASNYLNQVSQVGPTGSLTYSYDYQNGYRDPQTGQMIPRTTATTTLSPEQQKLYDQNVGLSTALNDLAGKGLGYVGDAVSNPASAANLPKGGQAPQVPENLVNGVPVGNYQTGVGTSSAAPSGLVQGQSVNPNSPTAVGDTVTSNPLVNSAGNRDLQTGYNFSGVSRAPTLDDFAAQRDQVTNALMARAQPDLDRARQARESLLANQGINPGSEAYSAAQRDLGTTENDARMSALLAGSQEQQRLFNNAMAARQQGVNEQIAQGDLYNQAQTGMWSQGLANANLNNQSAGQDFQQRLAAQGQNFDQRLGSNNLDFSQRLAASGQNFQQNLAGTAQDYNQRANEADRQFTQNLANAGLYNQAQTDQFSQRFSNAGMNNTNAGNIFNMGLAGAQYLNQARQQALQEQDYYRNQPLNMLNALRSGNQVTMPTFGNVSGGAAIAAAPVYAATNDQYQAAMQNYNTQMQGYSALLGGLGTLGSAAIGKWGK